MSASQEEIVMEVITDCFMTERRNVTLEKTLRDDLDMDSFDEINLVIDLEDSFGITISDEEFAEIKTVGEVVALVARLSS